MMAGEENEGAGSLLAAAAMLDGNLVATPKKARCDKTRFQRDALLRSYQDDQTPSFEKRQALAEALGLRPKVVQVWFQNRRARAKAGIEAYGSARSSPSRTTESDLSDDEGEAEWEQEAEANAEAKAEAAEAWQWNDLSPPGTLARPAAAFTRKVHAPTASGGAPNSPGVSCALPDVGPMPVVSPSGVVPLGRSALCAAAARTFLPTDPARGLAYAAAPPPAPASPAAPVMPIVAATPLAPLAASPTPPPTPEMPAAPAPAPAPAAVALAAMAVAPGPGPAARVGRKNRMFGAGVALAAMAAAPGPAPPAPTAGGPAAADASKARMHQAAAARMEPLMSTVQRAAAAAAAAAYQKAMEAGMAEALAFTGLGATGLSALPAPSAPAAQPPKRRAEGPATPAAPKRRRRRRAEGSYLWKPLPLPGLYKQQHNQSAIA